MTDRWKMPPALDDRNTPDVNDIRWSLGPPNSARKGLTFQPNLLDGDCSGPEGPYPESSRMDRKTK